jgi:predicted RNA-binding Zn ribbon-like protein
MDALFLASHPALDFLNTRYGAPDRSIEAIEDGRAFLTWLAAATLLDAPLAAKLERRFGTAALDAAAAEARTLRAWAGAWIERWREAPRGDYAQEARRLNRLLAAETIYREVIPGKAGVQVADRRRFDSPDELVALVAAQVASLVATAQPTLIKRCAGAGCTLWFLDKTKAHGRLFCSAAVCGNRAKVAAFRRRQRGPG